jgi:hypothetical protein
VLIKVQVQQKKKKKKKGWHFVENLAGARFLLPGSLPQSTIPAAQTSTPN